MGQFDQEINDALEVEKERAPHPRRSTDNYPPNMHGGELLQKSQRDMDARVEEIIAQTGGMPQFSSPEEEEAFRAGISRVDPEIYFYDSHDQAGQGFGAKGVQDNEALQRAFAMGLERAAPTNTYPAEGYVGLNKNTGLTYPD